VWAQVTLKIRVKNKKRTLPQKGDLTVRLRLAHFHWGSTATKKAYLVAPNRLNVWKDSRESYG
jgi:hypothetical protein